MKKKKAEDRIADSSSGDAESLNGLTEMGMGKFALLVADEIINRPKPSAADISAALRAVGIHAPKLKPWKNRILKMLERLPKKTRHAVREDLLVYFAFINDYERAISFLVSPSRFSTQTRFVALDSLLALGRYSEALEFGEKYLTRAGRDSSDNFIYEGTATCMGIAGDHLGSILLRINAPIEGALEERIVQGMVESACALLVRHLSGRRERLRELRKSVSSDETQITVPGIQDELLLESETLCERMCKKLTALIPKKKRQHYNLSPIIDGADCRNGDPSPDLDARL